MRCKCPLFTLSVRNTAFPMLMAGGAKSLPRRELSAVAAACLPPAPADRDNENYRASVLNIHDTRYKRTGWPITVGDSGLDGQSLEGGTGRGEEGEEGVRVAMGWAGPALFPGCLPPPASSLWPLSLHRNGSRRDCGHTH